MSVLANCTQLHHRARAYASLHLRLLLLLLLIIYHTHSFRFQLLFFRIYNRIWGEPEYNLACDLSEWEQNVAHVVRWRVLFVVKS